MIRITICREKSRRKRNKLAINELVIESELQITEEVLNCLPVPYARIRRESSKAGHGEGDVWTSALREVHERADSL